MACHWWLFAWPGEIDNLSLAAILLVAGLSLSSDPFYYVYLAMQQLCH